MQKTIEVLAGVGVIAIVGIICVALRFAITG